MLPVLARLGGGATGNVSGAGGGTGSDRGKVFGSALTALLLAAASCVRISPGFTRLNDLSRIFIIWASRVLPVLPPNTTPIRRTPLRSTVATRLNPEASI